MDTGTCPVPMQGTAVVGTCQNSPHLFIPVVSGISSQWFVLSLIFKVVSMKQKELPDLNSNSSLLLMFHIVGGSGGKFMPFSLDLRAPDPFPVYSCMEPKLLLFSLPPFSDSGSRPESGGQVV